MPQNECKRPKTKTNFIYRCMLWNLINYGLRIYVCVWVCARGMREQQFAQQQPQHKGEFDNKHDNCLRCKWTEKCVFDSTETLTSAPSVLQAFVVDAAIAIILATCNTALTDASYLYRSKICTCICVLSLVYYFFFNHYLQLLSVWQEQCGNHEFNHNKNNKKLKKNGKDTTRLHPKNIATRCGKKFLKSSTAFALCTAGAISVKMVFSVWLRVRWEIWISFPPATSFCNKHMDIRIVPIATFVSCFVFVHSCFRQLYLLVGF